MGISTHSIARTLYLFSVFTTTRPPEGNEEIHLLVSEYLSNLGIPFKETEGRYASVHERGFLIDASAIPEEAIRVMCKNFSQESYIILESFIHGTYKATFTDVLSGAKEFKGYMRSFSKADIDKLNLDYTYRPDLKLYFSIWHTANTRIDDFEQEKKDYPYLTPAVQEASKVINPGILYFPPDNHALV